MSVYQWVTQILGPTGFFATWVYLYFGFIRPRRGERKAQRQETQDQLAARDAFLDGVEAIDGVIDGQEPAAIRLSFVEKELATNTSAVLALANRVNETNGTSKRNEAMLKKLIEAQGLTMERA